MESKLKKNVIMILESPLTIIGLCAKVLICLMAFIYLRWVRKGIHMGQKLHTYLECHELGQRNIKR